MVRVGGRARLRVAAAVDRLASRISPLIANRSRLRRSLHAIRKRLPTAPCAHAPERTDPPQTPDPLIELIAEFDRVSLRPFFVQIGANDGSKGDYLQSYVERGDWTGVLVEPIPYVFANLRSRHGSNPRLRLVNAAIADSDGDAELYYLPQDKDADLPPWYDALATFRKEVIAKHAPWIPGIESRIDTITVPTLTFDSLCQAQGIRTMDLVQMDTEGYDYEIIKQIDLDGYRPVLVMYEHYHLRPGEREACELHLERHGYQSISNFMDTLSVRTDPADDRSNSLTRLLTKLRDGVAP